MGLRKSVFGVASGLVGLLRTRLELLALEAADEKARLLKLLGMAFAALLFLTLAVLVFTVSIAVAFWPTENRYLALGLLAGLYAVLGVGLLVAVRQALLYGPPPFSATLEELGRDANCSSACATRMTRIRAGAGRTEPWPRSPSIDRAVRIELLRARAAIERESLAQGIASAGRKLEPASLLKSLLPGLASSNASRWALQAIGLARRYPLVSSSLSAMFMRGGKRFRLLKVAAGALVGWQLWKTWQEASGKDPDER